MDCNLNPNSQMKSPLLKQIQSSNCFQNQQLLIIKRQKLFLGSMMQKNFALSSKNPLVNYDALQDKHASFYFNGYGIKKHLKKLKKALQKQSFQKGYKEYAEMLNHKLSELEKSNENIHRKTKPYVQTLKQSSLQKLKKNHYLTSIGVSGSYVTPDQESLQKKPNISFQNLPNISKFKTSEPKNVTGVENNNNSEYKPQKSLSLMGKVTQKKGVSTNFSKQRANNSVQGSIRSVKNQSVKQVKITEVKHEDFMSFLKKRQEDILMASKTLVPTQSPSLIKEEASPSVSP